MKKVENTNFICEQCGQEVIAVKGRSFRNHCTNCLYSKHLDIRPGDRKSQCQGLMKAIGQRIHPKKGIQLLHQCQDCGHIHYNKIDETYDNFDKILLLEHY